MHFLSKGSNLSGKANLDWIVQLRNEKPDSMVLSGGADIEPSMKKRIKQNIGAYVPSVYFKESPKRSEKTLKINYKGNFADI